MKNPLLVPGLREMIAAGDFKALLDFCEATHPATAAEPISALSPSETWLVLRQAEPPLCAENFRHPDEDPFKRTPHKTPRRVEWRAAL